MPPTQQRWPGSFRDGGDPHTFHLREGVSNAQEEMGHGRLSPPQSDQRLFLFTLTFW